MTSSSVAPCPHLSGAVRANLYAQELNNSACLCIEIGQLERALFTLNRALDLVKFQERTGDIIPCLCYDCTLAGCIVNTETVMEQRNNDNNHDNFNASGDTAGYVCRRPIMVSARGHMMGPALQLVIVYNIGLAGHLTVIGQGDTTHRFLRIAQLSVESYRIVLDLQQAVLQGRYNNDGSDREQHERSQLPRWEDPMDTTAAEAGRPAPGGPAPGGPEVPPPPPPPDLASTVASLRFEMRVFNNAGQLYKQLHDHLHRHSGSGGGDDDSVPGAGFADQYESCRRQVLSIVMIVADHQMRQGEDRISSNWRIEIEGCLGNIMSVVLTPAYTAASA